jgi:hypothetical protein
MILIGNGNWRKKDGDDHKHSRGVVGLTAHHTIPLKR